MATPYEWRIDAIVPSPTRAERSLWKVDSLAGDMGRVQHTVRETCTNIDELRLTLQGALERIETLERSIRSIEEQNAINQ